MLSTFSFESSQRPKNLQSIHTSDYILEPARTARNFIRLFQVRRSIETSTSTSANMLNALSTTDKFDLNAQHIIIRSRKSNDIVGGFRLTLLTESSTLSCESIFDISPIKKKSTRLLEVSRLFLLPEHKHRHSLQLIATSIYEFFCLTHSEYIISSQSLNTRASQLAALVARYFASTGKTNLDCSCSVVPKHQVPNFQHWYNHYKENLTENEIQECSPLLSADLKESLNLGAKVSATPALDRSANRIDFLTILDKGDLNKSLWKKSFSRSESSVKLSFS